LGAGAGVLHDCGSGISIAQAKFEDISNESIIIGGLPSSFTFGIPAPKDDIVGPVTGGAGTAAFEGSRDEDGTLFEGFGGDFAALVRTWSSVSMTGSF
jgi:hypothetical protein